MRTMHRWLTVILLVISATRGHAQSPVATYLSTLIVKPWSAHIHIVTRDDQGGEHLFQAFHEKQFTPADVEVNLAAGYVRLHVAGESEYIIPFENIAFVVYTDLGPPQAFRLDLHLKR